MKRVPLKEIRKVLKVADYIGTEKEKLNMVYEITNEGFTCANYNGTFFFKWENAFWKTLYWLPAELLGNSKIAEIKKQRSKKEKPFDGAKQTVLLGTAIPIVPTRLEDLDMPDWLTSYLKEHEIYTVSVLLTMSRPVLEKIGLAKEALSLINYCLSHFNLSLKD